MRKIMAMMLLVVFSAAYAVAQTQFNPITQINWSMLTGSGAPTSGCPTTVTGTVTSGSASISVSSASGILVNQAVTGSGIPSGASVVSVALSTNTVKMSQNATSTGSESVSFYSLGRPYTDTLNNVSYVCLSSGWTSQGVVSDGSGTSTAGEVALSTSVKHVLTYSTALPNGTAATTQTSGDSSTNVATDAFVHAVVGTGALSVGTTPISGGTGGDILYDNAGVLGNLATTGTGSVALAASPALTGTPTAPTASPGTNTTQMATTAFVQAAVAVGSVTVGTTTVSGGTSGDILYDNAGVLGNLATTGTGSVALAASPALTGTPTAPTAATVTNNTQLATTAFAHAAVSAGPIGIGTTALSGGTNGFMLFNSAGVLGNVQLVPAANGGNGFDASASTGVGQWSSGSYSVGTALANGTTATTQGSGDSSTDVATDAFVHNVAGGVTFATLPGGTNTSSAYIVSTGASLAVSGTGTIQSTSVLTGTSANSTPYYCAGFASTSASQQSPVAVQSDCYFQHPPGFPTAFTLGGSMQMANFNAATSGTNQSSSTFGQTGNYWDGFASTVDSWSWQNDLGSGSNPTSTYTLSHTGSPGTASVDIPYPVTVSSCSGCGTSAMFSFINCGSSTCYTIFSGAGTGSLEPNNQQPSPTNGNVTSLHVLLNSGDPGNGQTVTVTLRVSGSSQSLTCTITGNGSSNTTCSDSSHSVSVSPGNLLDWQIVSSTGGSPPVTGYLSAAWQGK